MQINKLPLSIVLALAAASSAAQVVSPVEIRDPELRILQQRSMANLSQAGQSIAGHRFNFPFYFSRKLDIDEKQQKRSDQHSIRFERYNGATVIAISGNYYGAYASDQFTKEERAKETFEQVVVPILKAVVPLFQGNGTVEGFAIEVAHHVITKTMGMPIERPENLMVYFPQDAARKLVAAQNHLAEEVAMVDAQVFLNANQVNLWLTEDEPATANETARFASDTAAVTMLPAATTVIESSSAKLIRAAVETPALPDAKPVVAITPAPAPPPVRDISPESLAALQTSIQGVSNHMQKELEPAAHFVAYAPPAFIAFHRQAYLELSMTTVLSEPLDASRYKLAALAFDEHISPLIRRVLGYFPGDQTFDGISFSTTIKGRTKQGVAAPAPLSVEFFFPLEALRRYASYDCTGQQLLDSGIVLINGERAGLDLQLAQGSSQH